jgi:hypothetical protein
LQAPVSPAAGPGPVPVFFTETVRTPVCASPSTVILTESWCSETRVTPVTETPAPTCTVGWGANPSPRIVIVVDVPRAADDGATDSMRGSGIARRNTSLASFVSPPTRSALREVNAT